MEDLTVRSNIAKETHREKTGYWHKQGFPEKYPNKSGYI